MSYGSSTIGASGCGPTSMAIIISTLTGQTVTPQMTCAYSIANGEYVPGMGTSHSFPTNAAYHWGLTCERVGKDRMNYVVQSLKEGKMVVEICEAYTITGSGSGHFIVLTGVTRDGYITIADCASRERTGKVYSVETIKSYGRDLSEGAFWIVGKNEGNTVKKIRSTEQILVLAILLFTYFLETFQVAYAQKAENLPQIVSWQDGKGYQSDGTFIADGWGYDTVNPAGKYVLFDENGMVQLRTETMDPVNAEDEYSGTELEPANIAVRAEIFEGFTGKVHVTIEENGGVQREIDLDSSVFLNGTCP